LLRKYPLSPAAQCWGPVAKDGSTTAHSAARRALETFASIGAISFNVTWTNFADHSHQVTRKGRKRFSFTHTARKIRSFSATLCVKQKPSFSYTELVTAKANIFAGF
jgi:hypothetical protein